MADKNSLVEIGNDDQDQAQTQQKQVSSSSLTNKKGMLKIRSVVGLMGITSYKNQLQKGLQRNGPGRALLALTLESSPEDRAILLVKMRERTQLENKMLTAATGEFPYFKQLNQSGSNVQANLHYRICKDLRFEFYHKGTVLFYEGELSNKFFLLLRGSVAVLLPKNPTQIQEESARLRNESAQWHQAAPNLVQRMLRIRIFQRLVTKVFVVVQFLKLLKRKSSKIAKQGSQRSWGQYSGSTSERRKKNSYKIDFNMFWELRQQILEQYHGVDLLYLSNPTRFFDQNVFRYHFSRILQQQTVFGELGLLNDRPRSATIVAVQDCFIATLSAQQYRSTLKQVDQEKMAKKVSVLKPCLMPAGTQISHEKMSKLHQYFTKEKYVCGQFVVHQDERIGRIFIVASGELELSRIREEPTQAPLTLEEQISAQEAIYKPQPARQACEFKAPHEQRLKILTKGYLFGEESFFQKEEQYSYSARIISPKASLYVITCENFERMLQENDEIKVFLQKNFAKKFAYDQQHPHDKQVLHVSRPGKRIKHHFHIKRSIDEHIDVLNKLPSNIKPKFFVGAAQISQSRPKTVQLPDAQHDKRQLQEDNPFRKKLHLRRSNDFSTEFIKIIATNAKMIRQRRQEPVDYHQLYLYTKNVCCPPKEKRFSSLQFNSVQQQPQQSAKVTASSSQIKRQKKGSPKHQSTRISPPKNSLENLLLVQSPQQELHIKHTVLPTHSSHKGTASAGIKRQSTENDNIKADTSNELYFGMHLTSYISPHNQKYSQGSLIDAQQTPLTIYQSSSVVGEGEKSLHEHVKRQRHNLSVQFIAKDEVCVPVRSAWTSGTHLAIQKKQSQNFSRGSAFASSAMSFQHMSSPHARDQQQDEQFAMVQDQEVMEVEERNSRTTGTRAQSSGTLKADYSTVQKRLRELISPANGRNRSSALFGASPSYSSFRQAEQLSGGGRSTASLQQQNCTPGAAVVDTVRKQRNMHKIIILNHMGKPMNFYIENKAQEEQKNTFSPDLRSTKSTFLSDKIKYSVKNSQHKNKILQQ